MAKQETDITHHIQLEASSVGARLFKNVRGMFLTIDGSRKVRAGLQAAGASDLVGATPLKITEDMVGKTLAIFTVVEVKTEDGRVSPEQQHFIDFVLKIGGFAGVARTVEDYRKIINKGG